MAVAFNISELRNLAGQLTEKLDVPFNQLTHSFLKRRLNEVFDKNGWRKAEQLIEKINDDSFVDQFLLSFSVNTTELFRDPGFWRQLRKQIPVLKSTGNLKILLPDLASGEELYSLLILLHEIGYVGSTTITVQHYSNLRLEQVKKGILATRKMDVNAYNYKRYEGSNSLDDYFVESSDGYCFDTKLLHNVEFKKAGCELSNDFEIVIFRNTMLYYLKDYHNSFKESFDKSLKPGGLLCLGVKEMLAEPFENRFEAVDTKEKIYRKYAFLKG